MPTPPDGDAQSLPYSTPGGRDPKVFDENGEPAGTYDSLQDTEIWEDIAQEINALASHIDNLGSQVDALGDKIDALEEMLGRLERYLAPRITNPGLQRLREAIRG